MSARTPSSPSVSLFPFLAVLMCTMGALILLLIVTSRRIRREAVARSLPHVGVPTSVGTVAKPMRDPIAKRRLKSVQLRKPKPPDPIPVEPQLPKLRPIVKAPAETDRIVAEYRAGIIKTNTKREADLARLRSELAVIQHRKNELSRQLAAAVQRRDTSDKELKRLEASQTALATSAADGARQIAKLKAEIAAQGKLSDGIRRKLARLKLKQAQASSKYSIVAFDGRSGTTRRPIFIECTKESIRFLPEGVEITAGDLLGFTPDNNPLLAGAQRLLHYWIAKAQTSGNPNEPEPYVLLLVRPSGSVAYYAARRMLQGLDQSVGYELIEADWDLHLPPADPQAKAICELAVRQSLGHRLPLPRDFRKSLGSGSGDPVAAPLGAPNAKVMRFNRSTGRFEVIQNENQPSLGPFGGVVDGDAHSGKATAKPATPGRGGLPSTTPSGNPPATLRGPSFGSDPSRRTDFQSVRQKPNAEGNREPSPPSPFRLPPSATPRPATARTSGRAESTAQQELWPLNRKGPAGSPDGLDGSNSVGNSKDATASRKQTPTGPTGNDGNSRRELSVDSNQSDASHNGRQTKSGGGAATPGFGVFGNSGGRPSRFASLRRWGLSSPNATIGFEREIDVAVTTDRLVVRNKQTIRVGNGETRDELVKRLETAIQREVLSWGKPPDSFYWVPTLKFVISPGGNRHYERLAGRVKELGLHAIAEHRLETPPTARKRR